MFRLLHNALGRLRVGRKLLLIFLLDMTAVVFVSGIMINEKYLAIDFARKEEAGQAYIAQLRDPLLTLGRLAAQPPQEKRWPTLADGVAAAEAQWGSGMASAEEAKRFADALRQVRDRPSDGNPAWVTQTQRQAMQAGRDLVTRVGNQSNLILDPDLDSYYAMSIVVLRLPELLEASTALTRAALAPPPAQSPVRDASGLVETDDFRARYLLLEGRLDAVLQGLSADYEEAYASTRQTGMRSALEPGRWALVTAVNALRSAARATMDPAVQADGAQIGAARAMQVATEDELRRAHLAVVAALGQSWQQVDGQLALLLRLRIEGFFSRMWLHLGTALILLAIILTAVFFVASQIARPLRHLSGVMDAVAASGDHSLRAQWDSQDEIGRLVRGFNDMLVQLDRERALQQELAASARAAEAQRAMVEALPIPLVVTSVPDHQVLHANAPGQRWLGERRDNPWRDGLDPAVRVRFFQQLFDRESVDEFEVLWRVGSEPSWAVLSARRVQFQGRDAVLTAFTPINHLKLMERRLELWAKVFQASSEGILVVDAQHRLLTANRAFCQATLYDLHDLVGDPPAFFDDGQGPNAFLQHLWPQVDQRGSWQGEVSIRRRNGRQYPAWLMVNAVRESQAPGYQGPPVIAHYIATTIDISDRKQHEERIRFLAQHDVLTELPNRSLCQERLREAIAAAQTVGGRVAVLFIDLDRFKTINDSLGHHVGDGLLRSVARRLVEVVRGSDTVCRLGGDEFVVILREVADVAEIRHVVEDRLVPRIRAAHDVGGAELHVSCSVGIAVYPDDATDIDTLMRHADAAMYQAKAAGRDAARFFTPELNAQAHERMRIESALRHAIERDELSLVVQPRIDAGSGDVVGVEALLRWQSSELGPVPPARFIPVAEEAGLIVAIGRWVIEAACALQASWYAQALVDVPIALNVSALQLRDGTLPRTLADALATHRLPGEAIEVELTESSLMDNVDHTLMQLRNIKSQGISLAIDDFGTGYSSLHYLNRFPMDRLKVDRSFVRDMLDDSTSHAITRAIIGLGHTLGMRVVAEGVEHDSVADALRASGCDELQGYLYAKPMAPDVFVDWLRQRRQQLAPGREAPVNAASSVTLAPLN